MGKPHECSFSRWPGASSFRVTDPCSRRTPGPATSTKASALFPGPRATLPSSAQALSLPDYNSALLS